jgi:hypothetical protein
MQWEKLKEIVKATAIAKGKMPIEVRTADDEPIVTVELKGGGPGEPWVLYLSDQEPRTRD